MSDIAIKVEGLGKKYTILHEQGGGYRTLRETMASAAKAVAGRIRHPLTPYNRESAEEYWALKDINFEVKQGDRIGIIGRNGAGKSTLLKVLSRITEPSTGKVSINGRVASLLEVGTGFHPELSGRENIYLNGAILGMKRSEIKRKFDEIVDFAEVEKFLDTPVKRYSSGMYVRLAFAVAAHLEPEILVVDEVLAVGDAQFQKKCLGKMEDVSKNQGRTVLFVSHNMPAVQQLCRTGILLRQGSMQLIAPVEKVVEAYASNLSSGEITATTGVGNELIRRGDGKARFTDIQILNESNAIVQRFEFGERVRFHCSVKINQSIPCLYFSVVIRHLGALGYITNIVKRIVDSPLEDGQNLEFTVEADTSKLRPGEYPLYFWIGPHRHGNFDIIDGMIGPMVFGARGDWEQLGFDPGSPVGVVSMDAEVKDLQIR